jgi:hypothetical protein
MAYFGVHFARSIGIGLAWRSWIGSSTMALDRDVDGAQCCHLSYAMDQTGDSCCGNSGILVGARKIANRLQAQI